MTAALRRMPPPPPVVADPQMNRWFHDITAFIANSGGIDPSAFPDLTALQAEVSTNTSSIASINGSIGVLNSEVATHTSQISTLNTQMTAANAAISALQGNAVVRSGGAAPASGLGSNGDWFADIVNKHIYVKSAGAYVLII